MTLGRGIPEQHRQSHPIGIDLLNPPLTLPPAKKPNPQHVAGLSIQNPTNMNGPMIAKQDTLILSPIVRPQQNDVHRMGIKVVLPDHRTASDYEALT